MNCQKFLHELVHLACVKTLIPAGGLGHSVSYGRSFTATTHPTIAGIIHWSARHANLPAYRTAKCAQTLKCQNLYYLLNLLSAHSDILMLETPVKTVVSRGRYWFA